MSLRPTRAAASKGREGIRPSAQTGSVKRKSDSLHSLLMTTMTTTSMPLIAARTRTRKADVSEEDDDEEEDGERENDEPLSQESADLLPSSPIRRRDDDVSDPILLIMHVTTATSCFLPKTFSISSNALLKEMSPVKRQRVKAPVLQGVTSSSSVPRPLLPTRRVADQPPPLPIVFEEEEDGDDDFVTDHAVAGYPVPVRPPVHSLTLLDSCPTIKGRRCPFNSSYKHSNSLSSLMQAALCTRSHKGRSRKEICGDHACQGGCRLHAHCSGNGGHDAPHATFFYPNKKGVDNGMAKKTCAKLRVTAKSQTKR